MRKIYYGLNRLFQPLMYNFIQHQGKDDGRYLTHHDLTDSNNQRIANDIPAVRLAEEQLKIFQTDPLRAEPAFYRFEILERGKNAGPGSGIEQECKDHAG